MALSLTSSTPDPDSKWIRQQLILDPLPENEVDYRSPYFVAQGIPTQHFLPIYGHNKLPSTLQATVPYQKALYSDEEAEFLLESPWKPVPKTVPCDTIIDVEPALEVNLNTRDVQTAKFLAGPWLPASASRAARLAPIRKNETVAAATVHKSPRVPRPRQTTQASPQKTLKPAAYQSRRAFHTVKAPLPKTVSVKKVLQKRGPVADPGSPGRRAASSCPDSVQGLSDAPSNPLERELDSDRASVADVLDHEQYVMLQVFVAFSLQPQVPIILKAMATSTTLETIEMALARYTATPELSHRRIPKCLDARAYDLRVANGNGSVNLFYMPLVAEKAISDQLPEFPFLMVLTAKPPQPVPKYMADSLPVAKTVSPVASVKDEIQVVVEEPSVPLTSERTDDLPPDSPGTRARKFRGSLFWSDSRQDAEDEIMLSALPAYGPGEKRDLRKDMDALYAHYHGSFKSKLQRGLSFSTHLECPCSSCHPDSLPPPFHLQTSWYER